MIRILLCEDDFYIRSAIKELLTVDSIEVIDVDNGEAGLQLLQDRRFHLLITDLMMPGLSGEKLVTKIKEQGINVNIVCISAIEDEETILKMYDLNVIEYIVKPINFNILEKKIKRILSLLNIKSDFVVFDKSSCSVSFGSNKYVLSRKEYELLEYLHSFHGQYFTKYDLLNELWYGNMNMSEKIVEVTISRLRKNLKEDGYKIKTIKNKGYTYED